MHAFHYGERTKQPTIAIDQALAAALQAGVPPGQETQAVGKLKRVIIAWFLELTPPRLTAWTKFGPDRQLLGYNQAIDDLETNIAAEDPKPGTGDAGSGENSLS